MRKLIEYTLASIDGVVESPPAHGFMAYRDDAYLRDGLGQLFACEAMLMGRTTYESFSQIWPESDHPWAARLNQIRKYVFSSTLETVEWENSTLVNGDAVTEIMALKQQDGGDLLVYGHGRLAETILRNQLTDVLDLSVHPLFVGTGKQLFREGLSVKLKLVGTKTFSNIVKLAYEPQY
jgi:dihydrofolate reductase